VKITVIGTGYVGLVTGTCLAETGNDVVCVDCDRAKIDVLNRGEIPIYEPGLAELVKRNAEAGRLRFTTDLAAVASSRLIFLAVGTPPADDGSVDTSAVWSAIEGVARHLRADSIVVCKSTVPVGTNASIARRLRESTGKEIEVASNPEFLKEGAAIEDFMKPDRIIVGTNNPQTADVLAELYQPYLKTDKPFLVMSPESAEMAKHAANCLLAAKISFINEMANICGPAGADVNDVRRGIGYDRRIGFGFLFPGTGYGGSCFPKDVRALAAVARAHGVEPRMLDAVHEVNERQKRLLGEWIETHFDGALADKTIAIWGLAYKPGTDDIRNAPSVVLLERLLALGATLTVHDPVAMDNVRRVFGEKLTYCARRDDALAEADALAIVTEWKQFVHPDFEEMKRIMRRPVIFDGRNLYDPRRMREYGFTYYSIGRMTVVAT
jgi:UDPglucose 6-dehydrogenase